MLNIGELSQGIEEVEFLFLVVLAIVEIGIDLLFAHKRNYQDTGANIAIAIVYSIASTTMIYLVVLTGLSFFSQFSFSKIPTNGWTLILAVIIADFIYYWEHRTEHRIRFFWAYHNVHHSST
ncbi:MAG: hypothetical protein RLZZ535_773, partial [Cyanobacteriota bacterium]